jgi:hypothetical protein
LNIVMGCFTAFAGIVVFIIMGSIAQVVAAAADGQDSAVAVPIVTAIGVAVGIFLLILSAPSIVGGWGLLHFKPWSRILMIIVSIFHLFHLPLGTALGVYGLWVLFSDDARRILESGGYVPFGYPAAATVPPQQPTYPPPGV